MTVKGDVILKIILETKNLTYSYSSSKLALDHIDMQFEEGKIIFVLGANGAGKSTLFLNLNGILQPDEGEVLYRGEPISYRKKELYKLRSEVGIVFQNPDDQLFSATVFEDVSFGAVNLGCDDDEVRKRVNNVLSQLNIADLKDRPTHSLSFGQKKKTALAGVLVMQPKVIILDEPTAGLDPMGVSELMHLLKTICKEQNITIIISTHDIDVVPVYSDYVYVIENGKVLAKGTTNEIFSKPELLRANRLRLPRISHLLEILNKEDKLDVDFSAATISQARREIISCLERIKR